MSLEDQAKAYSRSSTRGVILQLCPWHDSSLTRRDTCGIKKDAFTAQQKIVNRKFTFGAKETLHHPPRDREAHDPLRGGKKKPRGTPIRP